MKVTVNELLEATAEPEVSVGAAGTVAGVPVSVKDAELVPIEFVARKAME